MTEMAIIKCWNTKDLYVKLRLDIMTIGLMG
jgi:hypothetical protein